MADIPQPYRNVDLILQGFGGLGQLGEGYAEQQAGEAMLHPEIEKYVLKLLEGEDPVKVGMEAANDPAVTALLQRVESPRQPLAPQFGVPDIEYGRGVVAPGAVSPEGGPQGGLVAAAGARGVPPQGGLGAMTEAPRGASVQAAPQAPAAPQVQQPVQRPPAPPMVAAEPAGPAGYQRAVAQGTPGFMLGRGVRSGAAEAAAATDLSAGYKALGSQPPAAPQRAGGPPPMPPAEPGALPAITSGPQAQPEEWMPSAAAEPGGAEPRALERTGMPSGGRMTTATQPPAPRERLRVRDLKQLAPIMPALVAGASRERVAQTKAQTEIRVNQLKQNVRGLLGMLKEQGLDTRNMENVLVAAEKLDVSQQQVVYNRAAEAANEALRARARVQAAAARPAAGPTDEYGKQLTAQINAVRNEIGRLGQLPPGMVDKARMDEATRTLNSLLVAYNRHQTNRGFPQTVPPPRPFEVGPARPGSEATFPWQTPVQPQKARSPGGREYTRVEPDMVKNETRYYDGNTLVDTVPGIR